MIEKRKFLAWWARLEERFGVTPGADAYLRYLESQRMDTASFETAAASVWATSRFFPRPADFLLVEAGAAWMAVLQHAPQLLPPASSRERWDEARAVIPDRAFTALQTIGGPAAVRDSHDIARLRREFLDAFELVVIEGARGAFELGDGGRPLAIAARASA